MKRSLLCIASACVIAFAGCSKDEDTPRIVNPQDASLVHMATLINSSEIALGQLAADSSTTQAIKDFGMAMVTEHSASAAALEALASRLGIVTPDTLHRRHVQLMEDLKTLKGVSFDSLYIHNQVSDHENAINLFQTAHGLGNNTEVKDFINATVPHLQQHLQAAQTLAQGY